MADTNDSLVSNAEFARRCGVNRSTIHKAVKTDRLGDAVVGKKINLHHPLAVAYLAEKELVHEQKDKASQAEDLAAALFTSDDESEAPPRVDNLKDVENLLLSAQDLTLREIIVTYGTLAEFKKAVESLGKIQDYLNRVDVGRERRGELVERASDSAVLFGLLDQAFRRVICDAPTSMSSEIVAIVLANQNEEDLHKKVAAHITDHLSPIMKNVKNHMIQQVQNVKRRGSD